MYAYYAPAKVSWSPIQVLLFFSRCAATNIGILQSALEMHSHIMCVGCQPPRLVWSASPSGYVLTRCTFYFFTMCPLRNALYAHACKKQFFFDEMFIGTASSNFTFSEHGFTERARHLDIWTEQPIHIIVWSMTAGQAPTLHNRLSSKCLKAQKGKMHNNCTC